MRRKKEKGNTELKRNESGSEGKPKRINQERIGDKSLNNK